MRRFWRYILPCYAFTLPMTIVGFVLAVAVYRARSWVWYEGLLLCVAGRCADGTTRIWGKPNAQTLGWVQIYDSEQNRGMPDIRVHESVHVVQAFRLALWGALPWVFPAIGGWVSWWIPVVGGFLGGIGFAVGYGLSFLFHWVRGGCGDWYSAYMANPFEIEAYKFQDDYITAQSSKPWGA